MRNRRGISSPAACGELLQVIILLASHLGEPGSNPDGDLRMWESCRTITLLRWLALRCENPRERHPRLRRDANQRARAPQDRCTNRYSSASPFSRFAGWFDYSPPTYTNRVRFPTRSLPDFPRVGIVPDDAIGRWVFSGISRFSTLSYQDSAPARALISYWRGEFAGLPSICVIVDGMTSDGGKERTAGVQAKQMSGSWEGVGLSRDWRPIYIEGREPKGLL
ncbi:hypothetical protein PR048_024944 [Dryococelus australis]|uniref:Uncharacterized protein n=1 Tax=Dryococelus australis TaxID=614101 RepID=A0ABQ9GQ43_9NEOP|nr:hypothetical protein PR048_024944 [Dryococelus australis]